MHTAGEIGGRFDERQNEVKHLLSRFPFSLKMHLCQLLKNRVLLEKKKIITLYKK